MLIQRKGLLLDGIGAELVRASVGGVRKTLSQWLGLIPVTVSTYAALTAQTRLATGGIYCTLGKAAFADGGFGFWRYDASSSTTANGGTVLAIDGGGAGRFFRLMPDTGTYQLGWFNGATTNIATALQAAIDAIETAGGGALVIPKPPGTQWEINAAVTFDGTVPLEICGRGNPIIFQTAAAGGLVLGQDNVASQHLVRLRDFRLWSDGTGLIGIRAYDLANLVFERVGFYKWGTGSLRATACYGLRLFECRVVDDSASPQSDYGIYLDEATVNSCTIDGGSVAGFLGASARGIVAVADAVSDGYGLTVQNVAFDDNTTDIEIDAGAGNALIGLNVLNCYTERTDAGGARFIRVQSGVPTKNVSWRNCQLINKWVDIQAGDGVTEDSNTYHWNGTVINIGASVTNWRLGNSQYPGGGTITIPDDREWQRVGAWASYAVAWTSSGTAPALGNGTMVAYYKRDGNTVFYRVRLVWGTTTTGGTGTWRFSLPFTGVALTSVYSGHAYYLDSGTTEGFNTLTPAIFGPSATYAAMRNNTGGAGVTATSPITWATSDELHIQGCYECA